MADAAVEVLARWALSPSLVDLPRRLRCLNLRSAQVLAELQGDDPLGFYGQVMEVDTFADDDAKLLSDFARVVEQRASLEKRAAGTETHLDVVIECLKRKAADEAKVVVYDGPLPGLRAAAAYRRGGLGARRPWRRRT